MSSVRRSPAADARIRRSSPIRRRRRRRLRPGRPGLAPAPTAPLSSRRPPAASILRTSGGEGRASGTLGLVRRLRTACGARACGGPLPDTPGGSCRGGGGGGGGGGRAERRLPPTAARGRAAPDVRSVLAPGGVAWQPAPEHAYAGPSSPLRRPSSPAPTATF